MAFQARLKFQNDVAQSFPFDEVVRKLIEGPIKIVVCTDVALKCADQDFSVEPVVLVEGKIGPLAKQDAIRTMAWDQLIGDWYRLIQDVVKDFQLQIVDKKEPNGRLVEDWPDELLIGPKDGRWGFHAREVIERELDRLCPIRHAIDKIFDSLNRNALGGVEDDVGNWAFLSPFREILVVGKNDLAFVAVACVKPDVTGVTLAIVKEAEVEVVLGRIDLHPIRKAVEDKGEYDDRIIDRQRGGPRGFLDVGLIGLEAREFRALRWWDAFLRPRPVRELESEQCGSKDE